MFSFAAALLPGGVPGVKRQLDCAGERRALLFPQGCFSCWQCEHASCALNCASLLPPSIIPAGVVTTTYALCQALAQRHPQHAELACVTMQVSEDHCWLQTATPPIREASVEVTTDTAAKRGFPVAADAWRGWLYTGGAAVHCTPPRALAAAVTSINPTLSSGKKGVSAWAACRALSTPARMHVHSAAGCPLGAKPPPCPCHPSLLALQEDCEKLQAVQKRLLEVLLAEAPAALYPAALCTLADLLEVRRACCALLRCAALCCTVLFFHSCCALTLCCLPLLLLLSLFAGVLAR